ncbi:serine/threonine-protein kinase [Pyxidicoccus sp. MSG2]|uniref:serine/threonine-protein kinase n=1 Tax=Pyxidicoccus sp. MSG2 TaxID=2996790 RepID=UPI00226EA098|nr:serine/threonine-protein kinase [Pyxidicoccus sp. MSG2]MCY1022834.1 protein kinase [Pyxidicoccus sp. MSG2]
MANAGDDETPSGPRAAAPGDMATMDGALPVPDRSRALPFPDWERYEFLERLGQGGMGEVFEARDRRLGRRVALKFIRDANTERADRFLQEARTQVRIDHPHVCKVFEVGEVGGRPYIAMQLVAGQGLDHAASGMSLTEKVQVMRDVAAAVHEAHRLGVIHRDLKPSNILVERHEGGRWFPIVVDFGLAYDDAHGHGLTHTGALLGTPSYMAPEQARGDLAHIDRRTDVYSLGATFYELLTGVTPFSAATAADVVTKVLQEEPPSPRAHVPDLPGDLETLVLKCLNKEPEQRYASARALAEDLGRYLDGEPILARRPGLLYRWRRRARKHRALVGVSALSLASILVLSVLGARSWLEARHTRAQLATRARLAEQVGQQVKEIEWFLRTAYALPLHDTQREQQLVRERMARIASQARELDEYGQALIHYALGRGHLAMQEFEQAHAELTQAHQLGLDSPELHYALGQALGARYRQGLEDMRRGGDKAWVAKRQQALEQEYLVPALQSLERSRALELESPHYLEGLIALYRKDYDAAARAAARATVSAPWMYEARRLAGDVALARAVERRERGDYDAARAGLEEAATLYTQALEAGRSDASSYEALAQTWLERVDVELDQGRPARDALERTLAATAQAARAAPHRSMSYRQRAYALMRQYKVENTQGAVEKLEPVLTDWIASGLRAVERAPNDVYAHDALASGYYTRGLYEWRNQRDPHSFWDEAIVRLEHALQLQPDYPWALNDLALIHFNKGNHLREHGEDPRPEFAEAARYFEQAARADPQYLYAWSNQVHVYNALAEYGLGRGLDPEAHARRSIEAGERSLAINANHSSALGGMAAAELMRAQYLLEAGGDVRPPLERARQQLERGLRINPTDGRSHLYMAEAHHLAALQAMRDGGNPAAELEASRAALERAYRGAPGCVDCRVVGARVALTEAEWAGRQGRPSLPLLHRARAEAQRAVDMVPYFEAHQELARVYWRLAQALPPAGASAAIASGLDQVERALKLDGNLAQAHLIRGGLLLMRASGTDGLATRQEAALQARAAFARAFELNPLLLPRHQELAGEVESLLARLAASRGQR